MSARTEEADKTAEKLAELSAFYEANMIADRLTELAVAYYNGAPIVSDAAFDALEDKLRAMCPDHPRFRVVGAANWRDLVDEG